MKTIKVNIKLILSLSLVVLNFCSLILCQEPILLSKDDMPGYELVNESKIHWLVSEKNDVHFGIGQKWKMMNSEEDIYVYIEYVSFTTSTEAMQKTAFNSQSYSLKYTLGSPSKSKIGDETWIPSSKNTEESYAVLFVRGNIGIKVFIPLYKGKDLSQRIENISKLILVKVDNHLSNEQLE